MVTLRGTLSKRGYVYNSIFGNRAEDIYFESTEDLCFSLGYILKKVSRIDAEIPEDRNTILSNIVPNYSITQGFTSGGNDMKWAPQYRIYFHSINAIPLSLRGRLQNDNQMRITGSLFVEACMYIGFNPGRIQDSDLIFEVIREVFSDDEQQAFFDGYNVR